MSRCSTDEFARRLLERVGTRPTPVPSLQVAQELVATSFYASMEREEGRDLAFAVAYIDHEEFSAPHGNVSLWCAFELIEPRSFDVETLAKLGPAINPQGAVLAVASEGAKLQVIGIVRMTTASLRLNRGEVAQASAAPWASLALRIIKTGHLHAFVGNNFVMSFARGIVLDHQPVACFRSGVVFDRLWMLAHEAGLEGSHYLRTIERVVALIAERGHGGAVLIHGGQDGQGIKDGYRVKEGATNLKDAVHALEGRDHGGVRLYLSDHKADETDDERIAREARIPLERAILRHGEVEGFFDDATRFAANLTNVDGALVLRPDLTTQAFGARITSPENDTKVMHAVTSEAVSLTDEFPIKNLGTRHNSAARFCIAYPGSLAFVVSEDGPITVMIRRSGTEPLLVWRPVELVSHWPFPAQPDPTV